MRQTDQPQPLHREPRLDGTDGRHLFCHQRGVAASRHDWESPGAQLLFQLRQQFRDQAAIAEHGTAEHRVFRVFADDRLWLGDLDARQQGGFLVQIIGHRREARRNDAAGIVLVGVDDVKRHRSAEVHHDHRATETRLRGDGVGQAVGADRAWLGIIDSDADHGPWRELQCWAIPSFAEQLLERRVQPGHDAAKNGPGEGVALGQAQQLGQVRLRLAKRDGFARKRHIGHDALGIRRRGLGVRVANVHQQNHAA